jgi:hypothetical protein
MAERLYLLVVAAGGKCKIFRVKLQGYLSLFLGAFAKLPKATISFVMSVRPSVRMEQLGFHWTDFHEIWYLGIFRKSVEKIKVSLKSNKNDGNFTRRLTFFYRISLISW